MSKRVDAVCCSLLSSGDIVVALCVLHPEVFEKGLALEILRKAVRSLQQQYARETLRFVLPTLAFAQAVEFLEFDGESLVTRRTHVKWRPITDDALLAALGRVLPTNPNFRLYTNGRRSPLRYTSDDSQ